MNHKEEVTWPNIALRVLVNSASHPIEYARVLIQIGHEPVSPQPTKTVFGKPALALPNVFQYMSYIKSVDGVAGCYRGLVPKLCANAISAITFQKVTEIVQSSRSEDEKSDDDEELTEEERRLIFVQSLTSDVIARAAAVIASQPFSVIAVRMMAQFVGGESKYSGLFSSIVEVYHENGVPGFFSGLVPRLLGEVSCLVLASSITFIINSYIVEDRELRPYTSAFATFVAGAITYPFQVVSNCMAVTGSGLIAGKPPHMPIYTSWVDCWSHLSRTNQLKRGSSLLWRYYIGNLAKCSSVQGHSRPSVKNGFSAVTY